MLQSVAAFSRNDGAVLAAALGLLPLASLGLRLVGLRRMLALVESRAVASRRFTGDDPRDVARIAWLVEIAARCWLPKPTCLAKALVVFSLLKRRGRPAKLVIGVTKAQGSLEGHAWVELGGAAVVAAAGPVSYTALVRLPTGQRAAASLALGGPVP